MAVHSGDDHSGNHQAGDHQAGGVAGASAAAERDRVRLHTKPTLWISGVLLALAIVLPLWVPSYARDTPRLWGFPFFYWYQLLWVFLCAALVSIAHQLMLRDERRRREERRSSGTSGRGVAK